MTKPKLNLKKVGRPSNYTDKIGEEICIAIAENVKGLQHLCDLNPHWPIASSIRRWLTTNAEFRAIYDKAKESQCHLMAEEILLIADDTSRDTIINKKGDEVCNSEFISRSRLRVDTRKWLCAKLMPKLYGDKLTTDGTLTVMTHEQALKELE